MILLGAFFALTSFGFPERGGFLRQVQWPDLTQIWTVKRELFQRCASKQMRQGAARLTHTVKIVNVSNITINPSQHVMIPVEHATLKSILLKCWLFNFDMLLTCRSQRLDVLVEHDQGNASGFTPLRPVTSWEPLRTGSHWDLLISVHIIY